MRRGEKTTANSLDDLDLKVASELELDPRQTTRELAKKLGVSATTISSRIRRMTDIGAIAFCAVADPMSVGFDIRMVCGLNVTSGRTVNTVKALASCRSIQMISSTVGHYDIVIDALFHDKKELLDWITKELSQVSGVTNFDAMISLKIIKNSYMFSHNEGALIERSSTARLDETDLRLVCELQSDPRQSIACLANRTGTPRRTTAQRIKRFLEADVVRVAAVANPKVLGLNVCAYFFFRMQRDKILSAAHALAAIGRIRHVAVVVGPFDVVAFATFENLDEISQFAANELGKIPGINHHETVIQFEASHLSFRRLGLVFKD